MLLSSDYKTEPTKNFGATKNVGQFVTHKGKYVFYYYFIFVCCYRCCPFSPFTHFFPNFRRHILNVTAVMNND